MQRRVPNAECTSESGRKMKKIDKLPEQRFEQLPEQNQSPTVAQRNINVSVRTGIKAGITITISDSGASGSSGDGGAVTVST
jgi:hypothetical protein